MQFYSLLDIPGKVKSDYGTILAYKTSLFYYNKKISSIAKDH